MNTGKEIDSEMWTIGHSNRYPSDLLALLRESGIERLVDVRSHPASRRFPWFDRDRLEPALAEAGIVYAWEGKALGGLRKARTVDGEHHPALEAAGLRAFARHMEGPTFREAVDRLLAEERSRTAILCAEADPHRCHRALIADHLAIVRECPVSHIIGPAHQQRHAVHPGARASGDVLLYDRHHTERLL